MSRPSAVSRDTRVRPPTVRIRSIMEIGPTPRISPALPARALSGRHAALLLCERAQAKPLLHGPGDGPVADQLHMPRIDLLLHGGEAHPDRRQALERASHA